MKKFSILLAVAFALPIFWIPQALLAQTVTWDRKALGQQQKNPCGGMFTWPNNNNWSQQEVISTACMQNYVLQPSNWSTPTYPNGASLNVILGAPAPTRLDLQVTLNSLTVLSGAGNLQIAGSSSLDVQSYDFQTDGAFASGGGAGFIPFIRVAGLFRKSAGAGILDIGGVDGNNLVYFNMEGGTVQVDSGTLKLGRGESTGQHDQQDDRERKPRVGRDHGLARPRPARKVSSSRRCSSNIWASSSGSAWS